MFPLGSTIEDGVWWSPKAERGDKRYVVFARADERRAGRRVD
jgi:hypothetical protein